MNNPEAHIGFPEKERLQEKCGIIGIYNPTPSYQFDMALTAGYGVQHRGQNGVGIASQTPNELVIHTANGLLKETINDGVLKKFQNPSIYTLLHCRYGTNGDYQERNIQPTLATSARGEQIAVIHNGEFVGVEELRKKIQGDVPNGASDTYMFTQLLAQSDLPPIEAVLNTLKQVNGAYSLIMGIGNSMFIARDEFGLRPLVIGNVGDRWVAASETHALDKIRVKTIRQVNRGEIIHINENGLHVLREGKNEPGNFCNIETAYFQRPDSHSPIDPKKDRNDNPDGWQSLYRFRKECGIILAHEAPIKDATFVIGIPDSGIPVGNGYAQALPTRTPNLQLILRDHYDINGGRRLFLDDENKEGIVGNVLGKLSLVPDPYLWKNAIVVLADDSLIRGSVSKQVTQAVFSMGAKEVHWVIGFPPIQHTCHLGVSMRSQEELIAARHGGNAQKNRR